MKEEKDKTILKKPCVFTSAEDRFNFKALKTHRFNQNFTNRQNDVKVWCKSAFFYLKEFQTLHQNPNVLNPYLKKKKE